MSSLPKRPLTRDEITCLSDCGCQADDWTRIQVDMRFSPGQTIRHVTFSGDISLGFFSGEIATPDGLHFPAGIFHARLHDVSVGDNCLIRHTDITGAAIGQGAFINRTGLIACSGETSFANGETVNVLAESGGRGVPLWRSLSAQTAHLLCHLKGTPETKALLAIIKQDIEGITSRRCVISNGCRIERAGTLRNVFLEEGAIVEGASSLVNCYVASSRAAPAVIGEGVAAETCVFQKASHTTSGVRLTHCLAGESTRLERGFSAEHSLFFANTFCSQGEAVAVMAGPFASSHHKASLMLACQCQFATFGSSANASNHNFKLGPLHGGILERGVKLGSGSYLHWPSAVGAFSTVLGRNTSHLDTRDFPFSLLVGEGAKTVLVPAANIFTIGLVRDDRKWRDRDERGDIDAPLDCYQNKMPAPLVLQAIDRGMAILTAAGQDGTSDIKTGGVTIPADRIASALTLYQAAGVYATGNALMHRLLENKKAHPPTLDAAVAALARQDHEEEDANAQGDWRDWAGLSLSPVAAATFRARLASGEFTSQTHLHAAFVNLQAAARQDEWPWLAKRWRTLHGQPDHESTRTFLADWRESITLRHNRLMRDALKEFAPDMMISHGCEQDREADFRHSRGTLATHPFITQITDERDRLLAFVDSIE